MVNRATTFCLNVKQMREKNEKKRYELRKKVNDIRWMLHNIIHIKKFFFIIFLDAPLNETVEA